MAPTVSESDRHSGAVRPCARGSSSHRCCRCSIQQIFNVTGSSKANLTVAPQPCRNVSAGVSDLNFAEQMTNFHPGVTAFRSSICRDLFYENSFVTPTNLELSNVRSSILPCRLRPAGEHCLDEIKTIIVGSWKTPIVIHSVHSLGRLPCVLGEVTLSTIRSPVNPGYPDYGVRAFHALFDEL